MHFSVETHLIQVRRDNICLNRVSKPPWILRPPSLPAQVSRHSGTAEELAPWLAWGGTAAQRVQQWRFTLWISAKTEQLYFCEALLDLISMLRNRSIQPPQSSHRLILFLAVRLSDLWEQFSHTHLHMGSYCSYACTGVWKRSEKVFSCCLRDKCEARRLFSALWQACCGLVCLYVTQKLQNDELRWH